MSMFSVIQVNRIYLIFNPVHFLVDSSGIHLVVMLYGVIMRFDSLREITTSLLAETRKLAHLGITFKIGRSTLADANKRRPESIFEAIYRDLYATYRHVLSSDSRSRRTPKWMDRLQIIDSTTITLFSNLLFKGVGRHPKTGRKKGGIKAHTVIHANEGVPSDVKFTSAATNDSFMLKPANFNDGDVLAMDRAYIDYAKLEELTRRGVIYVTKMKKKPLIRAVGGLYVAESRWPDGIPHPPRHIPQDCQRRCTYPAPCPHHKLCR